ncbi:MAG: betaine/proline/choline family ABC transporter ATP-binding protein [Pseudomonadota bacterium]
MTADPILSCQGLWKVFGAEAGSFDASLPTATMLERGWVPAVQDVSLSVDSGEIFVIMGLSGSGKSTLVRCFTRLIEPTAGSLILEGQDLLAADEASLIDLRRRKMGMVFQHFALLPNRSVLGNVAFPLQVQGWGRDKREARAREMIGLVGLEGREEHFPAELSGGQQQRVGIARSLASDPEVWFLDEPFSALDPLIRNDLQDELLRLQEKLGKTIVFITHDLDEATKIADRIAIMEQGRVIQIASPDALVLAPANDYVARFTAKVALPRVVRVRSIMRPLNGSALPASAPLAAEMTIEAAAPQIIESSADLAVVDREGQPIGCLERDAALRILAGIRPSPNDRLLAEK